MFLDDVTWQQLAFYAIYLFLVLSVLGYFDDRR